MTRRVMLISALWSALVLMAVAFGWTMAPVAALIVAYLLVVPGAAWVVGFDLGAGFESLLLSVVASVTMVTVASLVSLSTWGPFSGSQTVVFVVGGVWAVWGLAVVSRAVLPPPIAR